MNTDLNYSRSVCAHPLAGFAPSGSAPLAGSASYAFSSHQEMAREAPGRHVEQGGVLIPIPNAIERAAELLRSLSAVTSALRLNRV